MAYLGFQKGGGAPMWWGAREESGEGAMPASPRKKSFLCPQNNNFWCILTRFFISYRCNNGCKTYFLCHTTIMRVFEDDNTTNYYTVN